MATGSTPQLIALDWGTSNLRANLLGPGGLSLEQRSAPGGIMAVQNGQFAAALQALCGDWLAQFGCAVLASGMIGSRQGWQEAPYLDCPASLHRAAAALTQVDFHTPAAAKPRTLHIAPGLRYQDLSGAYDVMRGEETQIWGARLAPGSCCVLPGTHSKWAWTGEHAAAGQITRFATYMTGELYAVLTQHSILGRLMYFGPTATGAIPTGTARPLATDVFLAGATQGLQNHAQATHALFAARTAGLMNQAVPADLPDFLSGLLIGIEIGGALASASTGTGAGAGRAGNIVLIGDEALCQRYALALELAGLQSTRAAQDATTAGQWQLAQAAGLVPADGGA